MIQTLRLLSLYCLLVETCSECPQSQQDFIYCKQQRALSPRTVDPFTNLHECDVKKINNLFPCCQLLLQKATALQILVGTLICVKLTNLFNTNRCTTPSFCHKDPSNDKRNACQRFNSSVYTVHSIFPLKL